MARLSLYLLGPPRIERDGVPLKVDTRKAIALLAYLAVTGESYRRDSLVNLLWPEYDQSHGRAALRRTLSALKKALAGKWLLVDRETVGLNLEPDSSGQTIWIDVAEFRGHLAQCHTHDHASTQVCPACLTPLTEAVALYRDDFLCGFGLKDSFNFDDWQFFQAEALRRDLTGTLKRIAHYYGTQQNYELAIDYVRQWLERDQLSESAHYQMMQLYAWSGQRSTALRQYEECARMLKNQLGVMPQESTQELYQAIIEGRAPPPDSSLVQKIEKKDDTNAGLETQVIFSHDIAPSPISTSDIPKEEKRIVTVLFVDSSASFEWQGAVSPEDEALLANSLLEMLQNVLVKYGGKLEHGLGGSALAVFGKTRTRENDPELAIRTALEVCAETETLGLRVSVGINTGEVFLRGSDSNEQSAVSLMGTVVNQAVGLAGKAPAGKILVGETTHQLTQRTFEFTSHSLSIKGIDRQVTAYQVERQRLQAAQLRGSEGLKAELVGRDEELAKLKQNLAKALQGQGQMVSLIGETGVGKSRLVAELKAGALKVGDDKPAPLWLEGRCLELGTAASYWPFIDILREYFAWEGRDDNRQRLARIMASLQEMVKQGRLTKERVEQMWPYLGLLLSVRLDGEEEDRLKRESPEQIRQQTFLAISDFFLALAQQQPVVLVFEDLHWADNLSLDLISLLMEGLQSKPLLLLCVYRPEQEHRCWHLATIAAQKCRSCYAELHLHELTRQQSQRLVESLLTTENLPAQAKDLILSKSQGNPFFIEEIVHSLIEVDLIYQEDVVWRAHPALDATVVPHSIQSTILSRVDHLAAEWRHVLQIASVIGRVFQQGVLDFTAQQFDLANVLWGLEGRALIYQERTIPELEYSFKHVLLQEAVYQNIPQRRREAIHRQVAEAIEALYPDSLDEHYEKLAYHYDQSGNVGKAVEFLLKAGEKAKRSYANEAAITHLRRGLELLDTMPETPERIHQELTLLVALGVPLVHTAGHAAPEVEVTYNRARVLCEQIGDNPQLFQILVGLRRYYFGRGKLHTAHGLGERLLKLAQDQQDSSFLSRAHMMHGETLYCLGDFTRFLEHSQQGLALYNPQAHRFHVFLYGNDTGICCRGFAALALWYLGYPDQALAWSQEAISQAQTLTHPFTLVFTHFFTASLHQLCGESRIVQEQTETLLRISSEQEFALYLAWGTVLQGWALAHRNKPKEGVAQMQQGLDACQSIGVETNLSYFLSLLIETHGKLGKTNKGLELVHKAFKLIDKNDERYWEAELYRLKGELLLKAEGGQSNDTASENCLLDAETCFQRAIAVAQSQQAKSWELRATMSLCRLWQKQDKIDEARQMMAEIYNWFTEGYDTADLQEAKALLGELSEETRRGDHN